VYPESGYFTGFLGHQLFCLVQEDDGYYLDIISVQILGVQMGFSDYYLPGLLFA